MLAGELRQEGLEAFAGGDKGGLRVQGGEVRFAFAVLFKLPFNAGDILRGGQRDGMAKEQESQKLPLPVVGYFCQVLHVTADVELCAFVDVVLVLLVCERDAALSVAETSNCD